MSKVLGLDGKPIQTREFGEPGYLSGGTGKAAWDERTKAEKELMAKGSKMAEERHGLCVDVLNDKTLPFDKKTAMLRDLEVSFKLDCARINTDLTKLNRAHPGYRHGRHALYMDPEMLGKLLDEHLELMKKSHEPTN